LFILHNRRSLTNSLSEDRWFKSIWAHVRNPEYLSYSGFFVLKPINTPGDLLV